MKKLALASLLFASSCFAAPIGEVSTTFRLVGPNDKIVVDAVDDPDVQGVGCFFSFAQTGGLSGAVGLAENKSEFSIACRAYAQPVIRGNIAAQAQILEQSQNIFLKNMKIVRMYDKTRNTLVYVVYSRGLVDGSPKNSISVVPLSR